MKDFNIKMMSLEDIKPYENNPRNNDNAVELVANSISEFGFKVPIVIDKENTIVCGHTRYKACRLLGIEEVPCVIADDLNEEQIKAFRLADNKVSESAEWDWAKLNLELEDINFIDMQDFGFEFIDEDEHLTNQDSTQKLVENIENLGKAQYRDCEGKYDIPYIKPVYELPKIDEWIGFNYVLSDDDPQGKAVHFFLDDYQFERLWNNPDKYIDKLKEYVCVASPDFSPYGDMPMALQIYNHYRKHWIARYLQEHGVTVIPTIRASTDERCYEWYLDGEPKNSIVIISSMWSKKGEGKKQFQKEFNYMIENLEPSKVFIYGEQIEGCEFNNVECIKSFTRQRFDGKE